MLAHGKGLEVNDAAFFVDVIQAVGLCVQVLGQWVGPARAQAGVKALFSQAAAVGALPVQADQAGHAAIGQLQQLFAVDHADRFAFGFGVTGFGAAGALGGFFRLVLLLVVLLIVLFVALACLGLVCRAAWAGSGWLFWGAQFRGLCFVDCFGILCQVAQAGHCKGPYFAGGAGSTIGHACAQAGCAHGQTAAECG